MALVQVSQDMSLTSSFKEPEVKNAVCRGQGAIKNVADGLYALHQRRICHLDLKTPNIHLQSGVTKITDLGLSKLLVGDQTRTRTAAQGSFQWMAP